MKDSKKFKEKMTKLSEAPDMESDDAIDPGFFRELFSVVYYYFESKFPRNSKQHFCHVRINIVNGIQLVPEKE